MDLRSAELTKYAANAMLATRISFMNEMAVLAEAVGADIERVRLGIGADHRIGYGYLYPGIGYGGSCFPKDVRALQRTAGENRVEMRVVSAVEAANLRQKQLIVDKIVRRFGEDLSGRRFGSMGARIQAQYRRHAGSAEPRYHQGDCVAPRRRHRLRSSGNG